MIELTPEMLLTASALAGIVAVFVQFFVKPFLKKRELDGVWYYDAMLISIAYCASVLAAIGGYVANRQKIDTSVIAFVLEQSVIIAAFATYGYEVVKNLISFAGGAVNIFREARQEINVSVQTGGVQTGDDTEFNADVAGDDQD